MNTNTMETSILEMNPEELRNTAGGTFTANLYPNSDYEEAGIRVVKHFIDKDEFWWNGENIGHYNANAVTYYKIIFGYEPPTVDNAVRFYESWLRTWREYRNGKN